MTIPVLTDVSEMGERAACLQEIQEAAAKVAHYQALEVIIKRKIMKWKAGQEEAMERLGNPPRRLPNFKTILDKLDKAVKEFNQ
jgi:hypothetical protein